eukprot:TRINITY_DN1632_c0_g1_i2.p1 TRINITY_DN1632_c0_g1~~TRINITY_DN1632_c0_g1_i2.p1  ORF type:complete len:100 (+),score=39.91 TRINITY_DN1632_c0_g1_i2:246-545(+)
MKFINLVFLMVALSMAFAGYTHKHKKVPTPRPVPVYEYEEVSEKMEDDLGVDSMEPMGDKKCKCLKYCQGVCMEAECCETFKAKCRYVGKYPTLNKPSN